MRKRSLLFFILFILGAMPAMATTFGMVVETCPVCDQPTTVAQVMSYGSYVYQWESKYDLIYFPFDGPAYFWDCPSCGYVQLAPDFDDLATADKTKVMEYLSGVFQEGEELSFADTMERTRDITRIRGKDDDAFAWLNRVMIYNYRELDPGRAAELAREEIRLLEDHKGKLPCDPKTRYYLLGEYYRLAGNPEKAAELLEKSIHADCASSLIRDTVLASLCAGALVALALVILIKKMYSRKSRIVTVSICFVFAVAGVALAVRTASQIADKREMNEYYTEIAADRLELTKNPPPDVQSPLRPVAGESV